MGKQIAIENIEELRRQQGIDDFELRQAIRGLHVGDCVHLTLLSETRPFPGETLLVRITSIRGSAFRGKLATRPSSTGFAELRAGAPLVFTTAHIHSLPRGPAEE